MLYNTNGNNLIHNKNMVLLIKQMSPHQDKRKGGKTNCNL